MKKIVRLDRFLYIVAALLALGFIIRVVADYYQYQEAINSAPFYVYIIGRGISFLLPGIICLIVASYLKRKKGT